MRVTEKGQVTIPKDLRDLSASSRIARWSSSSQGDRRDAAPRRMRGRRARAAEVRELGETAASRERSTRRCRPDDCMHWLQGSRRWRRSSIPTCWSICRAASACRGLVAHGDQLWRRARAQCGDQPVDLFGNGCRFATVGRTRCGALPTSVLARRRCHGRRPLPRAGASGSTRRRRWRASVRSCRISSSARMPWCAGTNLLTRDPARYRTYFP